jgi:mono/diheme cytochrome c family protein
VRVIVEGGFAPATAGNPRYYGMPPFGHSLTRAEIAAVATYVRNAWGHQAAAVSELEVMASK